MSLRTFNSVDAAPFQTLILAHVEAADTKREGRVGAWSHYHALAARCGVSADMLRKIGNGSRATIAFDTADLIVIHLLGPQGWLTDPELRRVYEAALPGEAAA